MACNKTDVITLRELKEKSPEKFNLISALEEEKIPILEMSTLTQDGVMEVKKEVNKCTLWQQFRA